MSVERFHRGVGRAQSPCSAPIPVNSADRRETSSNVSSTASIGALELPNGASALTQLAWLLWMLQFVNVTLVLDHPVM